MLHFISKIVPTQSNTEEQDQRKNNARKCKI